MIVDYAASLKDRTPPRPFAGVQVEAAVDEEEGFRLELPPEWIREVLYKPHQKLAADMALVDADDRPKTGRALKSAQVLREAYAIAVIETETGCRQKEIHDLPPEDIRLDHPMPHFRIRYRRAKIDEDGRRTGGRMAKNRFSVRVVPLVGRALEVMREYPDGFPIHRGSRNYSANINNWIRRHKLFPKPPEPEQKYTMAGVRHSFESRMKAYEIHTDDRGEMMGHSVKSARNRELYGKRMPLDVRMKIARLISIGDHHDEDEKRLIHDGLRQLWKRWR